MKLAIVKDDGQSVRVTVAGKVTQYNLSPVQEPLAELLGPAVYGRYVTLDLSETMYLDSSGVGWLLMCHKRMREAGGKLTLQNPPSIVANLLRLLKLAQLFEIDPPGEDSAPEAGGLA